jgi:magnesium transporter
MARLLKKTDATRGAAPGSLIYVGEQRTEATHIQAIRFNKDIIEEWDVGNAREAFELVKPGYLCWINVTGIHEADVMSAFGESFGLHTLLVEDAMNTAQRPIFADYDTHIATVLKMLHVNHGLQAVETEQITLVAGQHYVLSFQEVAGDVFNPIRERIMRPTTRIRQRGADYLLFALLDAVVDNYIASIEYYGDAIENLEEKILQKVDKNDIHRISRFKREMSLLRRSVRPVLEITTQLERCENKLIEKRTLPYLRDLTDHVVQATEAIEVYREVLNDEMDMYNSTLSHRMNDIMRVLTIFSVIFIPLTFIAGVYGANFEYMPELSYKYGYLIFWLVLISVAVSMLLWFRRKRWL